MNAFRRGGELLPSRLTYSYGDLQCVDAGTPAPSGAGSNAKESQGSQKTALVVKAVFI